MNKWKKTILHKEEIPVRVYVNENDTSAVVFPLFGRYYRVSSDESALDLVLSCVYELKAVNTISYLQYTNSQEDTQVIFEEAA